MEQMRTRKNRTFQTGESSVASSESSVQQTHMQSVIFNTSIPIQTRREMFERFLVCTTGSQEEAIAALQQVIGERDVMEFCAQDPLGELICCDWQARLTKTSSKQ
jgi:hypothetical protein